MEEQLGMFDAGTGGTASATDLAWAAGFIDGEGCITITKKKPYGHQRTGWYALELIVTNTSKKTIDRIYGLFKCGGVYKTNRGHDEWKLCFQWRCSSDDARMVLERTMPYLFTKYDHARMAIEFANLPKVIAKKHRVPEWMVQERDRYFVEMRKLNGLSNSGRKKKNSDMSSCDAPQINIDLGYHNAN